MGAISDLKQAIEKYGLQSPSTIEPGKIQRFPGLNKSNTNRAAWVYLDHSLEFGAFGDWSTGLEVKWSLKTTTAYDPLLPNIDDYWVNNASNIINDNQEAISKAKQIWSYSTAAKESHLYVATKRITPFKARQNDNSLILPLQNISGEIQSLQFITESGAKPLLKGGKKKGNFIPVRYENRIKKFIICEGWATAYTLADQYVDWNVLSAIDCGNLKIVALSIRLQYPEAQIQIAADDDRQTPNNPGLKKARQAAIEARAALLIPAWPSNAPENLTDFNDLKNFLEDLENEPKH